MAGTEPNAEQEQMLMTDQGETRRDGDPADGVVEFDRGSPIPLYLQIKQYLARQISVWERQNDKFYTDSDLCDMFGVSRMTVRQAVQELVDDGLLKRSRGIGTFVVGRKIEERLTPLMDFRQLWVEAGRPVRLEVLKYETQPCPAGFAEDLGIARNAPVRYIFRRRTADTLPIALDHRYIPLSLAAGSEPGRCGDLDPARLLGSLPDEPCRDPSRGDDRRRR